MSSGGKSRVPFGGFTSIFWTSSANGDGGVRAPVLPPPPIWGSAEGREEWGLGLAERRGTVRGGKWRKDEKWVGKYGLK